MMDDRKQRIGQHTAQHPPPWAINALGPCPPTRPPGRNGRTRQRPSAPTGRPTPMTTPVTRSAPEPTRDTPD